VETKIGISGFLLDSEIKVSFSGRDIDKVSSTCRGFAKNVVVSWCWNSCANFSRKRWGCHFKIVPCAKQQ